jgi:hypothetical protein
MTKTCWKTMRNLLFIIFVFWPLNCLSENFLVRRFPVCREADTNRNPSDGFRQVYYRQVPGEAGWQLVIEKISEGGL